MTLPPRPHILVAGLLWSAVIFATPPVANAGVILAHPTYLQLNAGLVASWTFDRSAVAINNSGIFTALDTAGNKYDAIGGSAAQSPAVGVGKLGQAGDFDGTKNMLAAAASLGQTTAHTISAWIYPRAYGNDGSHYGAIVERVSGAIEWGLALDNIDVANGLTYLLNCSGGVMQVFAANSVTLNTWQHVAVTWSGGCANTSVTFYVNGVEKTRSGSSGVTNPPNDNGLSFEISSDSSDLYRYNGLMDEVRIYNRALSAVEVKRLYNIGGTFHFGRPNSTGSLSQGLVGWWTFDGADMAGTNPLTAFDRSGQRNFATSTGSRIPVMTFGKIGQGLSFDGVDDQVRALGNGSLDIADSISFSAWFKRRSLSGTHTILYNEVIAAATSYYGLHVRDADIRLSLGGGADTFHDVSVNWVTNRWYHIVATYDDPNNLVKIYLDGVKVYENTETQAGGNTNGVGTFFVGVEVSGNFFDRLIDDLRVYNRALSTDEVKRLYNIGGTLHSGVASSNGSLSNGLVGWWTFDGGDMSGVMAYDRSGNGAHGTLAAGPSRTIGKIGQALDFHSENNGVNYGEPASLTNLKSMSISAWIKLDSFPTCGGDQDIIEKAGGGATGWKFVLSCATSNGLGFYRYMTGVPNLIDRITSVDSITLGQWQHVLVTFASSTAAADVHIYVNGVEASYSDTTNGAGGIFNDIGTGGNISNGVDGRIDDVRVYNRVLTPDEIKRLYNMGR